METFKEVFEKFKDEKVVFSSYYKYAFVFKNENVTCGVGGIADDIYKLEIVANETRTLAEIEPTWISIVKNGKTYYDGNSW